jgi:putative spermidine/putrescine transport system ATP-binding protein
LVFSPEVVLLDEPMAALDKKLRANMQLEILRIAKQVGATVISVTHDQEEALVMSDRIALFNHGVLAQIGKPSELYETPETEFVADFIGEANLLNGKVSLDSRGAVVSSQGWRMVFDKGLAPIGRNDGIVKLVVRPETIRLSGGGAESNQAEGIVSAKIYLGVEYKLIVDLGGGQTLQVRSRQLRDIALLNVGDRINLTWNSDDVVVIGT